MKTFKSIIKKYAEILFPCLAVGVIIIAWQITATIYDAEIIMPSPLLTMKEFFSAFTEKEFYISVFLTLLRAFIAFIISYALAFVFAYFSYKSVYVKYFFYPLTVIARGIPTMSIILILFFMFSKEVSTVVIAFIVIFPISYSEILSHFTSLDDGVLQALKVYGVDDKKVLKEYIVPEIFEKSFFSGVNMLAFSVKLCISAEAVLQTPNSFGLLMTKAKTNLITGRLFAYTIIAVLLGILFEIIAKLIKKRIDKKRGAL